MNKLEEEKRLLEQKLSLLTKKQDRYGESKERIDETNLTENKNLEKNVIIINDLKEVFLNFTNWIHPEGTTSKNDISAACNDYLKFFGYFCLAFVWLKMMRISYENYDKNKEFYADKINTGNYYFEKIVPRAESHYKMAISGSKYTMSTKFN